MQDLLLVAVCLSIAHLERVVDLSVNVRACSELTTGQRSVLGCASFSLRFCTYVRA